MIAHVKGHVAEKFGSSVIVDVGGVGYEVQVAAGDYDVALINEEVKFYTHHHVREQSEELYGFSSLMSKRLFEMLISVQGVGPKAALAILSLGSGEMVRSAIANGDAAFVSGASGVGKKTAERVIVDLKDKVGMPSTTSADGGLPVSVMRGDDALDALMALGYNLAQATEALAKVDKTASTEERIKQALKGI